LSTTRGNPPTERSLIRVDAALCIAVTIAGSGVPLVVHPARPIGPRKDRPRPFLVAVCVFQLTTTAHCGGVKPEKSVPATDTGVTAMSCGAPVESSRTCDPTVTI